MRIDSEGLKEISEIIQFNYEDLKQSREMCNEIVIEDILIKFGLDRRKSRCIKRVHNSNIDYTIFNSVAILTGKLLENLDEISSRIDTSEGFECYIVTNIQSWCVYNKNKEIIKTESLEEISDGLVGDILEDQFFDYDTLSIKNISFENIEDVIKDYIDTLNEIDTEVSKKNYTEASNIARRKVSFLSDYIESENDYKDNNIENVSSEDNEVEELLNIVKNEENKCNSKENLVTSGELYPGEFSRYNNVEEDTEDTEDNEEYNNIEEEKESENELENECLDKHDNFMHVAIAEYKGPKEKIKAIITRPDEDNDFIRFAINNTSEKSAEEIANEMIEAIEVVKAERRLVSKIRHENLTDIYMGISATDKNNGTKITGTKYYLSKLNENCISEFVVTLFEAVNINLNDTFLEIENFSEENDEHYEIENVINEEYLNENEEFSGSAISNMRLRGNFVNNTVLDERTVSVINKVIDRVTGIKVEGKDKRIDCESTTEFAIGLIELLVTLYGKSVVKEMQDIRVAGKTFSLVMNIDKYNELVGEESELYEVEYTEETGEIAIYKADWIRMIYTLTDAFARIARNADIIYELSVKEDAFEELTENMIGDRTLTRNIRNILVNFV